MMSGTSQCAVESNWVPQETELDGLREVPGAAGLSPGVSTAQDVLLQAGYKIGVRLRTGPGVKDGMQESKET